MGRELSLHATTAIAARGSSRSFPKTRATSCSAASPRISSRSRTRCRLTLGTKLEHNDFSGFEVQPSVRLAWDSLPARTRGLPCRAPYACRRDSSATSLSKRHRPAAIRVRSCSATDDFDSEELLAYEVGYRWQPLDVLAFDLALFHNRYEGLASLEFGTPTLRIRAAV